MANQNASNEFEMKTKIKEYRAKHNLTQEKLADIVSVRRETIIFLEQGKYNPSLKLAYNVAKALGTTVEELFIFDN
jgi:putative transcriptional regulator